MKHLHDSYYGPIVCLSSISVEGESERARARESESESERERGHLFSVDTMIQDRGRSFVKI